MKQILFSFLLFWCISTSYSQDKQLEYEIERSKVTKAVEKWDAKMDSFFVAVKEQEIRLDQRVSDSSRTIEYLNSLINAFGQIFTILGIFIAIIALALPIITYQFGIKPSQKALKDLEANMDSRLENYLKNARNKEIENALKNIREGSAEFKSQAISFLALTQHEGFSENQMFQIYSILNKNWNEHSVKSQLAFILSTRRNDYADELFNGDDIMQDPVIKQMAYLYFAKTGFQNNLSGIIKILNGSQNQLQEFSTLAFNLMQYSSADVIRLFDNETIISSLEVATLQKMNTEFTSTLKSLNVDTSAFEKTYLSKIIKTA